MVRLTVVPVIPLALSEAMKTATLATSASVMSRRAWVLLASTSWNCSHVAPDTLGASLEGFLERACLRYGLRSQTDHANPVRCELGG